jgi:hypothetical protein
MRDTFLNLVYVMCEGNAKELKRAMGMQKEQAIDDRAWKAAPYSI